MNSSAQNIPDLLNSGNHGKRWYVVYTKPRREAIAQINLERQGYETYFPRVAEKKRRSGSLVTVIEPFFPRYLFVHLDPVEDNWSPIRFTRGVSGLVKFDGAAKEIDNGLIKLLRSNEDGEGLQSVKSRDWRNGDVVEIEQGPFAGYHCIFQQRRSADRVSVLLNVIGKPISATLHHSDLQLPRQV